MSDRISLVELRKRRVNAARTQTAVALDDIRVTVTAKELHDLIDAIEAADQFIQMAADMTRGEKRNDKITDRLANALDRFEFA